MYTTIPYTREDFFWTQWKAGDIQKQAERAVVELVQRVAAICSVPAAEKTFENTIYALDAAVAAFHGVEAKIDFLMNVSPSAEVREAAQKAVDVLQAKAIDMVSYNEELYAACKAYAAVAVDLDGPSQRLLDDTIRGYRRNGFDLALEARTELKANSKELQLLCTEFQKNINEDEKHIVVGPTDVEGLSETYLTGLKRTEAGEYIVTTAYPDYFPFIENAKNSVRRKELVDLFFKKGGDRNIELLSKILKLRQRNVSLLGYATHADYVTEERMAKNAATVGKFLNDLIQALKPGVEKDLSALTAAKRVETSDPAGELQYFDVQYYITQTKKNHYAVDSEIIREYFPLEHVLSELFSLYGTLLSVRFEPVTDFPVWHEDVQAYAVKNLDGSLVSYFTLDLHPRDGKYGHAAEFPVVIGHKALYAGSNDAYVAPLACMVANFPKATGERPSLMPHDQVETLFHEFGHVMHENLSRARFFSQAGTIVARDFVEAPSQMLENWVWSEEVLARLSRHYKTGDALPQELIRKMLSAKRHMESYFNMRQMALALFDFRLHTEDHASGIVELYNGIVAELLGVGLLPEHRWPAGFGHLAGGYDAGYYGYMWSKVYACDMFTRFESEGVLNAATGMDYRRKILEVGSSRDELESVKDFLGREPNNKAFLIELGLAE